MKVKEIAKLYSMANENELTIIVTRAKSHLEGEHVFCSAAVRALVERDAPILNLTAGEMIVRRGKLCVYAYER